MASPSPWPVGGLLPLLPVTGFPARIRGENESSWGHSRPPPLCTHQVFTRRTDRKSKSFLEVFPPLPFPSFSGNHKGSDACQWPDPGGSALALCATGLRFSAVGTHTRKGPSRPVETSRQEVSRSSWKTRDPHREKEGPGPLPTCDLGTPLGRAESCQSVTESADMGFSQRSHVPLGSRLLGNSVRVHGGQ